jgi:hypothetical protein
MVPSQTHAKLGWPGMQWDVWGGGGDRVIETPGHRGIERPKPHRRGRRCHTGIAGDGSDKSFGILVGYPGGGAARKAPIAVIGKGKTLPLIHADDSDQKTHRRGRRATWASSNPRQSGMSLEYSGIPGRGDRVGTSGHRDIGALENQHPHRRCHMGIVKLGESLEAERRVLS